MFLLLCNTRLFAHRFSKQKNCFSIHFWATNVHVGIWVEIIMPINKFMNVTNRRWIKQQRVSAHLLLKLTLTLLAPIGPGIERLYSPLFEAV